MNARELLKVAAGEVGVMECPAGSNNVKYNAAYYGKAVSGSAYPWCCAFVWWCFHQLGADDLVTKTASCTYLMTWLKNRGRQVRAADMAPGDLVFYNWAHGPGGSAANHVGIVETVRPDGSFVAIEGNTSVTSDDNGGAVMRRTRNLGVVVAVARPAYEKGAESMDEKELAALVAQLVEQRTPAQACYNTVEDLPEWAREEMGECLRLGIVRGTGAGLGMSLQDVKAAIYALRACRAAGGGGG